MDFSTEIAAIMRWAWHNAVPLGALFALCAAIFTGWYTWLTSRVLLLHKTPVIIAAETTNTELTSVRNAGQGAAFNVCVYQKGQLSILEFSWLADIGSGETKTLKPTVRVELIEEDPHFVYYQDVRRKWYATRLARHGYGLASVWEGRRWWFRVPIDIRLNARAETTVQYFRRVNRQWWRKAWNWVHPSN